MRKHTISVSERLLVACIAGQLFSQAPACQPRKAEIIMGKVVKRIREDFHNDNEYYTKRIEREMFYDYIENLLNCIDEFRELNLSHIEYENGIKVDDESRGKYRFTSRYDKEDAESWKHDFIDLDAFVSNVHRRFFDITEKEEDCFGCIHESTNTAYNCQTCTINPKFAVKYECHRNPSGKYTFACKYDCYRSFYICCEECDKIKKCDMKCKATSQTCGNRVVKDERYE